MSGMFMIEDSDGTSDGEWGKLMWVIDTGNVGGTSVIGVVVEGGIDRVGTGRVRSTGWEGGNSEMTGPEAGSCGMPPYPGRLSDGNGGAEPGGRLSTVATRVARSPIWRWSP
jgi:hypothetical protein